MNQEKRTLSRIATCTAAMAVLIIMSVGTTLGADLPEIKKRGILRHLGVPYANFVTGSGDGMDAELITLFAKQLGVRYQYVRTGWKDVIGDLSGKKVKVEGNDLEILGDVPVRGDVIANGLTRIPWRERIVDYSTPTFPTQVWLVARADSTMMPIIPAGDVNRDISAVKALLKGREVMGKGKTCLDPSLYQLEKTGAKVILFEGGLNELAPAIINGKAEATILDVPDALIALEKWPGKIKVIGPISQEQVMGCGFAKTSPLLREEFNKFFEKCKKDGTYKGLVKKYYPSVYMYYPDFFAEK